MSGRTRPLTGLVLVVGPDREGRAAVAASVADAARAEDARVVARTWRAPTSPRPRGLSSSVARATAALTRFLAAWRSWRRAAADAVVVVEGGWYDVVLDAPAHGLSNRVLAPASVLGLAVPRADVAVLVDASPGPPVRPVPESDDWAPWVWRELAPWMGHRVVHLAPGDDPARVVQALGGCGGTPAPRWSRVPFARRGRELRATVGPASGPAVAMFQPRHLAGRVGVALNSALVRARLTPPWVSPVDRIPELCRQIGVEAEGVATLRSGGPGRRVAGVAAAGELRLVLKVGPLGDPGLRREAEVLARVGGSRAEPVTPRLRWSGEWAGRFVIVTDAVPNRGTALSIEPHAVVGLCVALAKGGSWGEAVVHGDFVPWNLLDTPVGLGLLDWENARFAVDPMFDLAHFVIQQGAATGRYTPDEAARLLVSPRSPGSRYLEAVGVDPGDARTLVASYLDRVRRPVEFHERVRAVLRNP